jgi:hypothetical protein
MTCTQTEWNRINEAISIALVLTDKRRDSWNGEVILARQVLTKATITPEPDPNISPELQAHIRDWRKRQDRRLPV